VNTPLSILVTPHVTKVTRARTAETPRLRYRWSAEIRRGDVTTCRVDGHLCPDTAIAAALREMVLACDTHEQILSVVASWFGDLSHRSVDVTLARAVRFAANRRRRHPGASVSIAQPVAGGTAEAPPALKLLKRPRTRKGGAV
jgi:hypothetical protein